MKKGLDASTDLTQFAACIAQKGYAFVCRYYCSSAAKALSTTEASALSAAGLGIVAVWENGSPTQSTYFNKTQGLNDGANAYTYAANTIKQPSFTPIYFAVDYDASQADIDGPITDYFNGVMAGFNQASGNNPVYLIGVYGSGLVCGAMLDANLATYSWLSLSSGWAGYATFNRYSIKQAAGDQECIEIAGGFPYDLDTSPNDQEGSFLLGTAGSAMLESDITIKNDATTEYAGTVNGIDVQAISGLPARCQAFVVNGSGNDTQVTAYDSNLQLQLEVASLLGAPVKITCKNDDIKSVVAISINNPDLFTMARAIAKVKNVQIDDSEEGRIRVLDR